MSSLTESFFISELIHNINNDKWYDTVYLCIEKDKKNTEIVNGFNCYSFKNFTQVDIYKNKQGFSKDKRVAVIPMCKWVPAIFHKYILNKTLRELYWKPNISLYRQPIHRK